VLSDHEQRVWDDIERSWVADAEEPDRPDPIAVQQRDRPLSDPAAAWAVIGVRVAIVLFLLGVPAAGLLVVAVIGIGWAVRRRRQPPRDPGDVYSSLEAGNGSTGPRPGRLEA
jgi:hypothetical protein